MYLLSLESYWIITFQTDAEIPTLLTGWEVMAGTLSKDSRWNPTYAHFHSNYSAGELVTSFRPSQYDISQKLLLLLKHF